MVVVAAVAAAVEDTEDVVRHMAAVAEAEGEQDMVLPAEEDIVVDTVLEALGIALTRVTAR